MKLLISIPIDCTQAETKKNRIIRFEDEVMDEIQNANKNSSLN